MKNTRKPGHLRATFAALVGLGLTLAVLPAHATIIASDSFTLNTTNRKALDTLNGVATEAGTGNLSWISSANFLFRKDVRNTDPDSSEGIASTYGSSTVGFGLDFSFGAYATHGSVATISFSSFYRINTTGYMAFGFGSGSTRISIGTAQGAVYVESDPKAKTWSLRSKGEILQSGTIPGTDSSSIEMVWIDYSLSYDNATHTVVDLSINGQSVVSNYTLGDTIAANMGTITAVTIMAQLPYSTDTGNGFDNFKLEVTSSPVPEPRTAALIGGAACLALVVLRKKMR
jgi:hypothetical protein